ncbi:flagellar biosynthetic protein FliR [Bacillus cytotoxicus]|uniref:Type III secretion system inner membrane R protein n=1 Tax=Bacillus cytotoxicus (strain DSM 22905 / CIP 110041 / 391-98 / NVH 391-98) TaxID=315749 RepID=A7GNJ6_BACCN|nr:flagellar biosynthetic protein FliR [Bacillus cytotoxicus]ABS21704.1 type III secretion system inner membrane R protein [Bacillus cytotoxicus NVH 391-98]AWC44402.1 flagellar type III secretion system protein FliR [Bacillus cytotoxicus]MDH2863067.1 flagellar type III secretion system protein FliR [Bacillus cytotoxicus]MDH2883004.1 flagellar type III secretion system protein FliR [Bacillus cytotoxicus]NZD31829.1 flagellar type III secretion system protein FliR [Bacillus cytotoxicus]
MNMELWAATFFAFCRITSFLYFLPFFSGRSVPAMAKVTFGLGLSITVADKVDVSHIQTVWDVVAYAGTQIVIGLALSKIVEILWNIPKMAGHILDFDIGLSQASLFDVNAGAQSTLLSTIFDIFFLIIFISLGGIDYFVATILKSFQYTEAISKLLTTNFLDSLLATLLFAITSAVEIVLPLMGSLFIINFVLILIAKNAPQLNVFMNAYVIKITCGILFIAMSVPMLGYVFKNMTDTLLEEYTKLFNFFLTK